MITEEKLKKELISASVMMKNLPPWMKRLESSSRKSNDTSQISRTSSLGASKKALNDIKSK